jgi:hypothetical protein
MKFLAIALALGLFALTSCNPSAKKDVSISVNKGGGSKVKVQLNEDQPADTVESTAPESVTLADGATVKVVEFATLDKDPKAFAGQVAIHGKVETVYSERGSFTLVDCAKMVGCKDACCSPTTIPMNVPTTEYDGTLPKENAEVIVIGTLTPGTTGFSFEVLEVREADKAIITRKAEAPAASNA